MAGTKGERSATLSLRIKHSRELTFARGGSLEDVAVRERNFPITVRNVIVLSDTAFVDGGAAGVALSSAIGLARIGLNVVVVSAVGPPMPELENEPNLRVVCSNQAHLADSPVDAFRNALWNERSADMVKTVLADFSPRDTVVHVHGWTKALSSSVFHTATMLGFKVIVTLHDYFSICPNGSLYLHPERKICKLQPMGARCMAKHCDSRHYAVKVYRVARQFVQNRFGGMPGAVKRFIAVSDFSSELIGPHLPADAKIYHVYNPTDWNDNGPANPEASDRFLYVGRFSPEKGVGLFAKAAKRAGVNAAFAGDGPSADEILELNPEAKLLGWLSSAQVEAELGQARALVLPSLWYETYGLTVVEAASMGVPAIVPDTNAASELVEHGKTGLWFKRGSARSLADAMHVMSEPGVAARMGLAAYKRYWSDPPTMEKHVARLLEVYEELFEDDEA